ncbi:MAG: hypothetical protein N2712_03185 [Brevinematales bacterium]|nr:hypothetical protein [Brevinematales bacterium]
MVILGVNDISISISENFNAELLLGPYPNKVGPKHKNISINHISLKNSIPRKKTHVIDLTFNSISSLMINDICLKLSNNLISLVVYNSKIVVKRVSKGSCVRCLIENNRTFSNYFVVKEMIPNLNILSEAISTAISSNKSYIISENDIKEFDFSKGCSSCIDGNYNFISGEYGEIINENCNDNSSMVFPIDDRQVDIMLLHNIFVRNGIKILDSTSDYINFVAENKTMFVFRNGRLIISSSNSKEESEYLYRKYIGS